MKTITKFKKVNDNRLIQERLRNKAIKSGVNLIAPETVFLSKDTIFGSNVTIEPYVVIGQKVKLGNNVLIKSFTHIEGAIVKDKVVIGPYARVRPGSIFLSDTKIGNFVETKNTVLGNKSKVNHLSYVGDTQVGKNSNIGAGTITCNFDGIRKNKTKISDNVFIGSNSSLIAPIKIEKDAVVGAGSVITKKVKKGSLALTRSNQIEIKKYKRKKKKR